MKKRITLILEVDSNDETMLSDEFIKLDIEQEIHCASNWYDIISFSSSVEGGDLNAYTKY